MKIEKSTFFRYLIYIMIVFPFLHVESIFSNTVLLHILQIFSSFIFLLLVLKERENIKINYMYIGLIMFSIYEMFISVFHGTLSLGIVFGIFFRIISIVYFCLCIQKKRYDIFNVIRLLLNFLIIINLPSVIKALSLPEYQKVYLLGGKNALSTIVVSAMFFNYLSSCLKSTKMNYIMIFLDMITLLLSGSSTGIIIGLLMIIFIVFMSNFNIKSIYYIIIYCILLVLVFNPTLIRNIDFLYNFITNFLNKNLTFTGRTIIWQTALKYIQSNFWGFGRGNSIIIQATGSIDECHNAILELLLCTGAPGLILFFNYFVTCMKIKKQSFNKRMINICIFTIFAFFIIGLTESTIFKIELWWIISITYCIGKYYKGCENVDNCIYTNL